MLTQADSRPSSFQRLLTMEQPQIRRNIRVSMIASKARESGYAPSIYDFPMRDACLPARQGTL